MKIDIAEVRRIARLACLEFPDRDEEALAAQLSSILTYVQSLGRLDTSGVEPTFHSVEHPGPLRDDVPRPGLGAHEATRGAPGSGAGTGGAFVVPKVIG